MIYLDNASTTLKKPFSVYYNSIKCMLLYNANPSRSGHELSFRAGLEVYKCRESVAKLFHAKAENVIFTSGCTEALNLALRGTAKQGGHIITTAFEHNSTLRVLQHLKQKEIITFTVVYPRSDGKFYIEDFENVIQENTYLLAINHISNVTGYKQDIEALGILAKKNNLLFLLDTAQSGGHAKIDMQKNNISLVAFAGHKGLFGLSGVGGLVVGENIKITPIKFGGTGTSSEDLNQPNTLPEGFESGTLPLVNIVALHYGIDYVLKKQDKIAEKTAKLSHFLLEKLSKMENITLYTETHSENGVVSFNVKNYSSSQVCDILNQKYKICTRSGLACAPLAHKYLDTLKYGGALRVSLSYFNKKAHIEKLLKALKKLDKA